MELVTPHNLEAEMAVLGSIFIDESLVTEIIDELYPCLLYTSDAADE